MKTIYFVILAIFIFAACESEADKNARLVEMLNKLEKRVKFKQEEFQRLKEEQEKALRSTAKERFAYLYDFEKERRRSLPYEKDIVSILFTQKSPKEYTASVEIRPDEEAIKPSFVIYLYNKKGLIIGSYYKKRTFLSKKIRKGQLEMQNYNIPIVEQETPHYFGIDYPHE